ncbi:Ribosomal lysine N-methyltransferase 5 [Pseudocercospora fuligena]|uniref:Ribosomal lysine N-methyltransferase 5 n=1 Tax=Pseudocercospora fuligena TaxID=685502 RepID=A0A8H6VPZ6_9PEZI|nr:Ribosomal lysine N-methyltransferase 5 [Pseudocercospora fuligena]
MTETFDLFSQSIPSQDLGMLDAKRNILEVSIAGRDFEIAQSPGLLQSQRDGGTTGAAVWQSTFRFAEWLASPENVLWQSGLLNAETTTLELGCGIAGLVPGVLNGKVRRTVSTDQTYILKTLKENLANNNIASQSFKAKAGKKHASPSSQVDIFSLDWEKDDVGSVMRENGLDSGVNVLLACDCIYNYALIEPFIQTCKDICSLRTSKDQSLFPTAVVIVQQLRQPEVFEQWLTTFHNSFQTWRIPSGLLSPGLKDDSGFAVHVGLLRQLSSGDQLYLGQ